MRRRPGLGRAAGLVVAASLALGTALAVNPRSTEPAEAQAPPFTLPTLIPPFTLPTLPPQLVPVLELVSPILYPACANAQVVAIAPGLLGLPELSALTGPVFVVCGSIPAPEGLRRCTLDSLLVELLSEVLTSTLGLPLPLVINPLAAILGQVQVIEDLLPPSPLQLTPVIAGVLQCAEAPAEEELSPLPPPPTTTATTAAPTTTSPPVTSGAAPPVRPAPPITAPPVQVAAPAITPTPTAPVSPASFVSVSPRFAYPIAMAAPLLLLLLGGYLGRSLTRPIVPTAASPRRRPRG